MSCDLASVETIFMKCLILFSGKNTCKENTTNLLSAELANLGPADPGYTLPLQKV